MSDDDDISWVAGSAKANSDMRAKLGLPLDGNYKPHGRSNDRQDYSGGGESLLVTILVGIIQLTIWAIRCGLWLAWHTGVAIVTAIFSRSR